jgi:hypothetical protein
MPVLLVGNVNRLTPPGAPEQWHFEEQTGPYMTDYATIDVWSAMAASKTPGIMLPLREAIPGAVRPIGKEFLRRAGLPDPICRYLGHPAKSLAPRMCIEQPRRPREL